MQPTETENKNDSPQSRQSLKALRQEQKRSRKERKLQSKQLKREARLARKAERVRMVSRDILDAEKAAGLLEDIVEGLKSGTVSVKQGDEELAVHPEGPIRCRVKSRQTHKSESISISLKWKRATDEGGSPDIEISSK